MNRIEEIKLRREKALADGSFFLRVPTWLTAGDGRDFCAAAPDDIEFLLEKLDVAVEALELCADVLNEADGAFTKNHAMDFDLITTAEKKARAALKKLRGEK